MSRPFGINYWKLWLASVITNLGDGVSTVAYPWLASALTRNPLHIAGVTLVVRLPWLLFSLPAGPVGFAGGVHWRKFEVDVLADPLSASRPGGATVFRVGNTIPFSGAEEVKEAFGELLIPILADQDYAKNLELNLAGRITDYETSGQVETWKIGVNYAMTDFLRFRATRSRDIRAPNIQELFAAGQTLIYPITDCNFQTASYLLFAEDYFLSRQAMIWFWDQYCPQLADRNHAYVSPMRAASHSGLPPALILTAEFDPLRDEAEDYARKLESAGVRSKRIRYDGMIHGFTRRFQLLDEAEHALDETVNWIHAHV